MQVYTKGSKRKEITKSDKVTQSRYILTIVNTAV